MKRALLLLCAVLGIFCISALSTAVIDVWRLPEVASPDSSNDVIGLVKSPGGTGMGRKMAVGNFKTWVLSSLGSLNSLLGTTTSRGMKSVWIASKPQSPTPTAGTGTPEDPYDGGTKTKFDNLMWNVIPANTVINLEGGHFVTGGFPVKDNWIIIGRGKEETSIDYPDGYVTIGIPLASMITTFSAVNYCEVRDLTVDNHRATQPIFSISTTISSGSNGLTLPRSSITVADASGFPSSVSFQIVGGGYPNQGSGVITCTGKSGNTFSGCTGGSGTMATGDTVRPTGTIEQCALLVKQGKIINVRFMTPWANPGEGFPIRLEHDGSNSPSDVLEIAGCEVIDARAPSMTAVSIFDQRGGVCTALIHDNTVTGYPNSSPFFSRVLAYGLRPISAISGFSTGTGLPLTGGVGKLIGNKAFGVTALTLEDTWDNNNSEIASNHAEVAPDQYFYGGSAIVMGSASNQSNFNIHDNYLQVGANGGNALTIRYNTAGLTVHDNTIVALGSNPGFNVDNTVNAIIKNNIVTENVASTFPAGVDASVGNTDSTGRRIYALKTYRALISQSGTAAPASTVLENTLGGTVVWARTSPGVYTATLTGAFTSNKTWALIGEQTKDVGEPINGFFRIDRTSANVMTLNVGDGTVNADDILQSAPVQILVYP